MTNTDGCKSPRKEGVSHPLWHISGQTAEGKANLPDVSPTTLFFLGAPGDFHHSWGFTETSINRTRFIMQKERPLPAVQNWILLVSISKQACWN